MKIFELINILNRSDILLNESMGLPELRRRIIKGEMRLDPNEEDWYRDENNRNELIDTMSRIVGPSPDTELNHELKKFDTSKYTEKGRIVKPESLNRALNLEILRVKNRITDENDNLSSQYEKLNIKKDVEIYSVFTPQANIELSHKILKNNVEPTWCIASPTGAAEMWEYYDLWTAEYPCVFTVVKRGIVNGIRNPKYQIKCNPELTEEFTKDKCNIFKFVDEVRDAEQSEETLHDTSLFKVTGIDAQTLENAMRKLMNTEKAYSFSKKYGADFNAQLDKLESDEPLSSNERIQLLINACKMGLFEYYIQKAKGREMPFFIDRLIEYKTLFPKMINEYRFSCLHKDNKVFNKMFNYFIKNKRCDSYILDKARGLDYPGIDEIYAKIFNSILVNDPKQFAKLKLSIIKKEYLERYVKVFPPKYFSDKLFARIIREHEDLNPNEVESISKIFLEKGTALRSLLDIAISWQQENYIPAICRMASKIKKITEDDIDFLLLNYKIHQIQKAVLEIGLKLPETFFSYDNINSLIRKDILYKLSKLVLSPTAVLLSEILLNNIKDVNNIPELSDIIKSDPDGSSEESKLHATIIKEYEVRDCSLSWISEDVEFLNKISIHNGIRELFNHFDGSDDYYFNEQLDDYPSTTYNLYRYNLYLILTSEL